MLLRPIRNEEDYETELEEIEALWDAADMLVQPYELQTSGPKMVV